MRIHRFAHMLGRPLLARLLAFMAKQPSVGTTFLVHRAVFVVDHQQAFVVLAIQGKKVQPVVVVAHLQCLCSSIFTAVALEGWCAIKQRRTPRCQHACGIARRYAQLIGRRGGNALKAHQWLAGRGLASRSAACQTSTQPQKHGGRQTCAAAQKAAP